MHCRISPSGLDWHAVATYGADNPSFLCTSARHRILYVAHGDFDRISSYAIDSDGALSLVASFGFGGRNPVHLALDPAERTLIVADHDAGMIALLPLGEDGVPVGPVRDIGLAPAGAPSSPHQIIFHPGSNVFFVPDKRRDEIRMFRLAADGAAEPSGTLSLPAGLGPRHLAFTASGDQAYLVNEFGSSVSHLLWDPASEQLSLSHSWSSLPAGAPPGNLAAAILLADDECSLVATNRGHDSLVRYRRDPVTGVLSDPEWLSSGGAVPRFATRIGDRIFVANEGGHNVHAFEQRGCTMVPLGPVLDIGSPVTIAFCS